MTDLRAHTGCVLALAASLATISTPSFAKDIVAFVDQVTATAPPGGILVLHNKRKWSSIIVDTINARLDGKSIKYDFQGYNEGDRPQDIARSFDWPNYGLVFCVGEAMECDQVKARAEEKGFEGNFYNGSLEQR